MRAEAAVRRPWPSIRRRVVFYGSVVALLVLIQTGVLRVVLASAIGPATAQEISGYLSQTSQGFFVVLAVALYFDLVRERAADDDLRTLVKEARTQVSDVGERLCRDALRLTPPAALLDHVISGAYGPAPGLDVLAGTILARLPVYRDVVIDYILEDLPDPDLYRLTNRMAFTVRALDEYVIAIVADGALADRVLATGDVCDVWKVSDRTGLAAAASEAVTSPVRVRIIQDGTPHTVDVPLHPVPRREQRTYLRDADGAEVVLLRALMPRGDPGAALHITTEFSYQMAKASHHCYWVADRPLFLQRLTFDGRNLTMGARALQYSCQPLFALAGSRVVEQDQRLSIDVYGWLVRGQGAILTWR